jgi:hypothetical protein
MGMLIPLDLRAKVGDGLSGRLLAFNFKSRNQTEECTMPIELLVPIAIFLLGVVVAISLSSLGIERVIEGNKQ